VVVDARRCNLWRVPANTGPTQADSKLIAELAERDLVATWAQLKRWRPAGLLDPPVRPGAGRGKGRPSKFYPATAVEQATAIIKLLDIGVPLEEMAIAMFLDGVPVSEVAVGKALHSILADPKAGILDVEEREDLVERRVNHLQRRARRVPQLQQFSKMTREAGNRYALPDIINAMIYAQQLGEFPGLATVKEAATMFGASIDEAELFYDYQRDLRPDVLRDAIDTVSLEELEVARSYLEGLFGGVLPVEARQNYRFFSIGVLWFALLLPTGAIETDLTALENIAALIAKS
jgi:hypothetical protein